MCLFVFAALKSFSAYKHYLFCMSDMKKRWIILLPKGTKTWRNGTGNLIPMFLTRFQGDQLKKRNSNKYWSCGFENNLWIGCENSYENHMSINNFMWCKVNKNLNYLYVFNKGLLLHKNYLLQLSIMAS